MDENRTMLIKIRACRAHGCEKSVEIVRYTKPRSSTHPLLLLVPPPFSSSASFLFPLSAPEVFPTIHAAMSKFCSGLAPLAPPDNTLFFCCSSNSARISGSTTFQVSAQPVLQHVQQGWRKHSKDDTYYCQVDMACPPRRQGQRPQ